MKKYRVMAIGEGYAAQLDNGMYISHDGSGMYLSPENIVKRCCVRNFECADDIGKRYVESENNCVELVNNAREVVA